ncbi:MAG: hypothetical protein J7J98_01325 [candidate division Zixibacteria bacterium]|nr:hypothetical protein [candidate division Zixibacteria bacterium]
MDIGLVYSENDPRQTETRDFLREFIKKHGVNATISETRKKVASPTLVINGEALKDMRQTPRKKNAPMFPGVKEIAAALEHHLWSL